MVKAVFFDWFNTLACYDPPRETLHSQLLGEFGIEITPAKLTPGLHAADKYIFREVINSPWYKKSSQEQFKIYLQYAHILLGESGISLDSNVIIRLVKQWPEMMKQARLVLYDDVLGTFKALKEKGLVLGVLSNATKDAVSVAQDLGLAPYLDFVVTSEEARADKPDPAIFQLALAKAGVVPAKAAHVGDQYEIDVVGARGVGIRPIMIDRNDLYPEVSDCPRIRGLDELEQYL